MANLRGVASTAAVIACLLGAPRAEADVAARLVFVRDGVASRCPDEPALRSAVEARLGYDPFLPWGTDTIMVRFEPDDTGFTARVELVMGGSSRGVRTLRTDDAACGGLVDAAALAVSIALDAIREKTGAAVTGPVSEGQPAREPPPVAPVVAPIEPFARDTPAEVVEPRTRVVPNAGVDGLASVGRAPTVAGGLRGWGRLRIQPWSLAAELNVFFPAPSGVQADGGTVSAMSVTAGVVPCYHLGPAFGCPVGEVGWLHASGSGVTHPQSGSELFLGVGPRLGAEVSLTKWLLLRGFADLLVDLTRATVTLDKSVAWSGSLVVGTFGAGLALQIP